MLLNENVALPVLTSPACEPDTTLQAVIEYTAPSLGMAAPSECLGVHDTVLEKQWSWWGIRIPASKLSPLRLSWDPILTLNP